MCARVNCYELMKYGKLLLRGSEYKISYLGAHAI